MCSSGFLLWMFWSPFLALFWLVLHNDWMYFRYKKFWNSVYYKEFHTRVPKITEWS